MFTKFKEGASTLVWKTGDGTWIYCYNPKTSGGARRRRPPTASRLKGPRKQKSFAYKLLKRGLAKSFAYKLLKRGLANLMSPTSTSAVAPPLPKTKQ
ncbi:hypothetical protein EVAR_43078_1 [Eumeta japonica]|uniref:Uncharacterized protein n=1 Tax=Eumeta variegata TaxID=151549 RepID=A0A4C1WWN8_EUMVA|nr:hypothetical protein EVAR_43078_1 [Eumeta japonica]